jgi:hypothetical protein
MPMTWVELKMSGDSRLLIVIAFLRIDLLWSYRYIYKIWTITKFTKFEQLLSHADPNALGWCAAILCQDIFNTILPMLCCWHDFFVLFKLKISINASLLVAVQP